MRSTSLLAFAAVGTAAVVKPAAPVDTLPSPPSAYFSAFYPIFDDQMHNLWYENG
jgi:hypothetical protein